MQRIDFRSDNDDYLNGIGIKQFKDVNNGNKEDWSMNAQPYYQELLYQIKPPDFFDFEKVINEVTDLYEGKYQCDLKRLLRQWEKKVEAILGHSVGNMVDFMHPDAIEEIPNFICSTDQSKKTALKKFYKMLFDNCSLSPAFDPLAARVMVHLDPKSRTPNKEIKKLHIANTGNQQLDHFLEANEKKLASIETEQAGTVLLGFNRKFCAK
ncbi:MAG: hypothetical protein U9N81_15015 [Bacillota bacterium]|nr:hypothetical protein [Bacillota bacterium]